MLKIYLKAGGLSKLIKYDLRTIRETLKDRVLFEGLQYIRPFGGRKILYIWEAIQKDIVKPQTQVFIPMANGGMAHG